MNLTLPRALQGVRVLSLALNLPGPAALQRCRAMGARCTKLEPPGGDPMRSYEAKAYDALHQGVRVLQADLKSTVGQQRLHRSLARTDVLLTSFRPSALRKLGLDWPTLHLRHPQLSLVRIVGEAGAGAETPGHDLTYQAAHDLVNGLDLPPSLFADMGGALMASEAVLQCQLQRQRKGQGVRVDVALAQAAGFLGLPRHWGLTLPGAAVGGGHAGYRVYACRDGRVAVAALEPHFAQRLCDAAGLRLRARQTLFSAATHRALALWLAGQSRAELDHLAQTQDLPLHTLA